MSTPLDQNSYGSLCVDLTYACNMSCTYCYNPIRDIPEMQLEYFEEACKKLPKDRKILWKFLGGEPTIHPQFFDFIQTAYKYGNHVYFSSNGIKYTNSQFMQKLKGLNLSFRPGLTLDGGCWHKDIYKAMSGDEKFADIKRDAFYSLIEYGIKNICLSAIIVRGLNERIIPEMLLLAYKHPKNVKYIHFRTAAMVGDWEATEPYVLDDLINLMKDHFTAEELKRRCIGECQNDGSRKCCHRFRPKHHLQISLIEFATKEAMKCPNRGKLKNNTFEVEEFFSDMVDTNEERIKSGSIPYVDKLQS